MLTAWVEANNNLPDDVSSLSGEVRLWPIQRKAADAIRDTLIERFTLANCVRVDFITIQSGALAGFIDNDSAPILCLLPTEADDRDYMVSDIEPIFAASTALAGLLSAGETDASDRNTLLYRSYPGGNLKIVAAKAPRNLRRHNVHILLCDEVDGMPDSAEGSPLVLAERRTFSFAAARLS